MKKKIFSGKMIALLAAAGVLLAGSAVGSTRAALTYYSENYGAEISVPSIGVSLAKRPGSCSRRCWRRAKSSRWANPTRKP